MTRVSAVRAERGMRSGVFLASETRAEVLRRRRVRRPSAGAMMLVLGLLAAGCVTFPQLESLSRTTSEPRRKKVREHAACLAASESQQDLLDCMDARGYQFIKASIDERAQECYSYRNARTGFPAAYCFEVKDKNEKAGQP